MNDEILIKRRTIREYSDKEISDDILNKICEVGMYAPTARNQKTSEFIIVKDKNTINKLSGVSAHSSFISKANAIICLVKVPDEKLLTPDMADQDLANMMTYMSLEAASLGIGACYLGIHPRADRIEYADNVLNISNGYHTFALLSLGYPISDDKFKENKAKIDQARIHKEKF